MRVIIVYTKDDEQLKRCWDSLKEHSPDLPIDMLKVKNPSDVTDPLIEYNKYFENMQDDIIIWHPDMVATKGWYEQVKKYYNEFDVIGLKLLYPNGLIQHYGGAIRPDGVGVHPEQYMLNIGYNEPQSVAYVTGPGTIIKQKVLGKIGGYDLQFVKGFYGDADWCLRAKEAGFSVGVIPVEVMHEENEGGRSKEKTRELLTKHSRIFITKHLNYLGTFK